MILGCSTIDSWGLQCFLHVAQYPLGPLHTTKTALTSHGVDSTSQTSEGALWYVSHKTFEVEPPRSALVILPHPRYACPD